MKNLAQQHCWILLLFCFYINNNIYSQTIASYDFESGLQGWTDGGSDSGLNTSSTYACNGSNSIYSKDDDLAQNLTTSPIIDLSSYTSIDFTFCYIGRSLENGEGFNLQYYNGSSWSTIGTFVRGTDFTSNNTSYTFSNSVNTGLVSNAQFRFVGTGNHDTEYNYFDDITIRVSTPIINIQGNGISITNGDATPAITDYTSYGTANISTLITRTYAINNNGAVNLNVTNISLSNTTDFSIIAPFFSSPIASSSSTTFTVQFNSITIGTKTCTITVTNNDPDNPSFQFDIDARAEQNFFDSDGDGILDNEDIDDDNDGIFDSDEEIACNVSSVSGITNYKFLNETFGEGNRTTINTTYDAITTYCYEDGTNGTPTSACPSLSSNNLNDGQYTVYYAAGNGDSTNQTPVGEVASWADAYWYTGEDHTTGDTNGRMAMFNASYDPGTFYTATIIGALPNIPITYSFWVLNLDTTTAPGIASRLRPDILVEFRDVNNNVLASITTGDIPPSINGDAAGSWHEFTANLTFNVSEFYVYFINNEVGGAGNDLAIDDIVISQTLCDTDNDGVADVFDLDSDNDGIPDVVEAGLGNYSDGNATLTGSSSWIDANANGMHDLTEGHTALDSDGDSVPNYLDLDSDNDSVFDVDESGAGNTGNSTYQNGDGDITGDGVGDGLDTDAVRETDIDSDGTIEYYSDGILDLYDFYNGGTMATAYGNSNQGSTGAGWQYYVADTDNDGIPDYLDITSDGSIYDISKTLHASLDGNNDGLIDDTNDAEGDGIVDLFDTDDANFGSPRDINTKLQLYFDGRNDYVAESTVINGWTEATIMAWIKIDPTATGNQIIIGQNEFYIQLNADKSLTTYANGYNISSSTTLTTNQWIHVAATYGCTDGAFHLYVNGSEVAVTSISGAITDTSSFTIGRTPDTDSNYFQGHIDEVRIFNKGLSDNELQKMIYQEIENASGNVRGSEIPIDITDFVSEVSITPITWASLERYYRLDTYKDDIIDDLTTASIDIGTGAKVYNAKVIDGQSAPLPFVTQQSGSLPTALNITADGVDGNDAITYDWSIVKIEHDNVFFNADQKHVGLIIEEPGLTPITFNVQNDSELNISWYLYINGKIDLEGESQLVQGADSYFNSISPGTVERDQQGSRDFYTYNYWSSPVGISNTTTNNNSYTLPNILSDGSLASAPLTITFLTSGHNGTQGTPGVTPIGIADYWVWKYANKIDDDYASWQHIRSTNTILAGEGYTMKGVANSPTSFLEEQNYVFNGKPNNGDITLTLSAGNDYLVGNPYASAIDADEFILDNVNDGAGRAASNIIDGTLYFWDHFAGNTHVLSEYQGGYATYTLIGGIVAISNDTRINASGAVGSKTPDRYIPVSQGFFVVADTGGNITFKNSQRIFKTEASDPSIFLKGGNSNGKTAKNNNDEDSRQKIRLMFDSPKGYHRQLLVGVDENATDNFDLGFDAKLIEDNVEDIFWRFADKNFIIQAVNNFDENQKLPIGIKISQEGLATIKIDSLENIENSVNIYLHDIETNTFHDLKQSDFEVYLPVGEYLNRFEIVFSNPQTLGNDVVENTNLEVYFSNEKNSVIIHNPATQLIETVEMFNILGQSLFKFNTDTYENYLEYNAKQIKVGTYILKIKTEFSTISKKVLIK